MALNHQEPPDHHDLVGGSPKQVGRGLVEVPYRDYGAFDKIEDQDVEHKRDEIRDDRVVSEDVVGEMGGQNTVVGNTGTPGMDVGDTGMAGHNKTECILFTFLISLPLFCESFIGFNFCLFEVEARS